MNERVAQLGNQFKGAVNKITVTWKEQEPVRKRRIIILAAAVLVAAIAIVVALNMVNGRYVVLFEDVSADEVTRGIGILETLESPISARTNNKGQLMVPSKDVNRATAQLAIQGIPTTTLDYSILDAAGGLTTTENEKNWAWINQQQNRLQDTIKTYNGVQNAIVQLNIQENSNRVWDVQANQSSASVSVTMKQGYILGTGQVNGIRNLVASAVGIDPLQVTVLDSDGNALATAGVVYDAQSAANVVLERIGLENAAEQNLIAKAVNQLSLRYPDANDYRVACKVSLDFDAMITEAKDYQPEPGTLAGVLDEEEIDAVLGFGQYAQGVVGETDNTDVPIYVDYDGDDNADSVDFHRYRDYAVDYVLKQITKDGPSVASASISVAVNGASNADQEQSLRMLIAGATDIPIEKVTVQSYLVPDPEVPVVQPWYVGIFGEDFNPLILYIILASLIAVIVVLVVVLSLRSKAKKKRLALEIAAAEAEQEEAERIQSEIEARKNELKNAALGEQKENAITEEVREFARQNPEITANLLRNWLKDGD
ncbi:hypothetical protein LJC64_00670 [Ruminococcaceae bacterium OttesenSCG-928-A11]|nr:hypothetical protein [Ruminococcaceae bacterium OttesenSCG-928-A11]